MHEPGREKLWQWFGLSYASFVVLPRVMMHEMPDDWQDKMADLLTEFHTRWPQDVDHIDGCSVSVKKSGKFVSMPKELVNYRHVDREALRKYGNR